MRHSYFVRKKDIKTPKSNSKNCTQSLLKSGLGRRKRSSRHSTMVSVITVQPSQNLEFLCTYQNLFHVSVHFKWRNGKKIPILYKKLFMNPYMNYKNKRVGCCGVHDKIKNWDGSTVPYYIRRLLNNFEMCSYLFRVSEISKKRNLCL